MKRSVIQTAFLGDCVLSLPFLYRLAEAFPHDEIDVLAAGPGLDLFKLALERGLAGISSRVRLHAFEKRGRHRGLRGLNAVARQLERPDVVYCLQRSFRSGLVALLSGAPERVGFSSGAATFFYTRAVRRSWHEGRLEIEKNLDLIRDDSRVVEPWVSSVAPSLLRVGPRESAPIEARVALSLGSPWATKRWPTENAIQLVKRLVREGIEIRLLGDAASQEAAAQITAAVPSLLIKNYCGQSSIREWVDLIDSSSLVVSGDSAAVHVASDLNVPVIALFGPTLPEFGFAPWRADSAALGLSQLPCRPCHIHGPKKCPLQHHRCLKDLSAEIVWDEIERMTFTKSAAKSSGR